MPISQPCHRSQSSLRFSALTSSPTFHAVPGVNTLMKAEGTFSTLGQYEVQGYKLPGLPTFYANFDTRKGFVATKINADSTIEYRGEKGVQTAFVQNLTPAEKHSLEVDSRELLTHFSRHDDSEDFDQVVRDLVLNRPGHTLTVEA